MGVARFDALTYAGAPVYSLERQAIRRQALKRYTLKRQALMRQTLMRQALKRQASIKVANVKAASMKPGIKYLLTCHNAPCIRKCINMSAVLITKHQN